MSDFNKYIKDEKNILIITSQPLDLDCLGSSLLLKRYLEKLDKKVTLYFPRQMSKEEKEFNRFLPGVREIKDLDTRNLFKSKKYDLVIFLDGSSLTQFYDSDKNSDDPPKLSIYPKRIHIDHHLNIVDPLGTKVYHDNKCSSTAEVLLTKVVPEKYWDSEICTLGYAAIFGDTGNFKWAFTAQTLDVAARLVKHGADIKMLLENLYSGREKSYYELLGYIIRNLEYNDSVRTVFLPISREKIEKDGLSDDELVELKRIFHSEIAKSVKGYDRGMVLREKRKDMVDISARGGYTNKINMPQMFEEAGGKGGGHFNACSFVFEGKFEDAQRAVIRSLKEHLND